MSTPCDRSTTEPPNRALKSSKAEAVALRRPPMPSAPRDGTDPTVLGGRPPP